MLEKPATSAKQPWSLIGPLFHCELIRQGRRSWNVILRCAYALILLVVLFLTYERAQLQYLFTSQAWGSSMADSLARLSQEMTSTILITQMIAILLLTPLYVAGAIVDERKRGTLELLYTTHLTSSEIVLGKLFARLLAIWLILLAGLPVLALVQFWGGTSVYVVVCGFAGAAIMLLHAGAVSIFFSVRSKSFTAAVLWTYGTLAVFLVCCCPVASFINPFMFLYEIPARLSGSSFQYAPALVPPTWHPLWIGLGLIGEFAVFQSVFIFLYLFEAVRGFPKMVRPAQLSPAAAGDILLNRPDRLLLNQPPLWWKELALRESAFSHLFIGISLSLCIFPGYVLFATLMVTFLLLVNGRFLEGHILTQWNEFFRVAWTGMVTAMCVLIAWQTAGSITHEREKRTLESWLTLPYTNEYLFRVKSLAAFRGLRWAAASLGVLLVAQTVLGVVHPLGTILLLIAVGVYSLFLAFFGMWLSAMCHSSTQAYLILGVVLVGLVAGSWYFVPRGSELLLIAINPVACCWSLGFSWESFQAQSLGETIRIAFGAGIGIAGYAILALLFWYLARRRFVFKTDQILDVPL
jgi:ABC-type transport system involved in multi-copper enzyme maturation permease subunit